MLVIIGLIVGGIVVGQELVRAAAVRAQIAQIEQFNSATRTFMGKFGALPGDLNQAVAAQFGFAARGSQQGQGDGNGFLEVSQTGNPSQVSSQLQIGGEIFQFWSDLTWANGMNLNLIPGNFNQVTPTSWINSGLTPTGLVSYLPQAAVGRGGFVYVFSSQGYYTTASANFFGVTGISSIAGGGDVSPIAVFAVKEAAALDKKIDDGFPQRGRVLAQTLNAYAMYWSANEAYAAQPWVTAHSLPNGFTTSSPASAASCFDNGGGTGPQQYSLSSASNGGSNVNCSLIFMLQ